VIRRLLVFLLTIPLLAACSDRRTDLTISFAPVFGEKAIDCDSSEGAVSLSDLRLYISNIQLFSEHGNTVDVQLHVDERWQQADLALLDFEDGSDACLNGTTTTNTTLRGSVPTGNYRGLKFTVGV